MTNGINRRCRARQQRREENRRTPAQIVELLPATIAAILLSLRFFQQAQIHVLERRSSGITALMAAPPSTSRRTSPAAVTCPFRPTDMTGPSHDHIIDPGGLEHRDLRCSIARQLHADAAAEQPRAQCRGRVEGDEARAQHRDAVRRRDSTSSRLCVESRTARCSSRSRRTSSRTSRALSRIETRRRLVEQHDRRARAAASARARRAASGLSTAAPARSRCAIRDRKQIERLDRPPAPGEARP